MKQRYSMLFSLGVGLLLAACGPETKAPAETLDPGSTAEPMTDVRSRCRPAFLVADLVPGSQGADPRNLVDVNGTLFFFTQEASGFTLWRSEGSAGSTRRLKTGFVDVPYFQAAAVGDMLFFLADDGVHGYELWTSDGTRAGTALVKDIAPGDASSSPTDFLDLDGTLYFVANDTLSGFELWRSDGTAAGTRQVKDIRPGPEGSRPAHLVAVDDDLFFFTADDGVHGEELWRSNGTPGGTRLVKDIRPGPEGSASFLLTDVAGTLFFSANDGVHGQELWKSDGHASDTMLVKDVNPGSADGSPFYLVAMGDLLLFTINDGVHGYEPWRSDGTKGGTQLLDDILPGSDSSQPGPPASTGQRVFFKADDAEHGNEMWITDGTTEGTQLLKDIRPGPDSALSGDPNPPYAVRGGAVFEAFTPGLGNTLWMSDGTTEGTVPVEFQSATVPTSPLWFTRSGPLLFFTANDPVHGRELWALPVACFPRAGHP